MTIEDSGATNSQQGFSTKEMLVRLDGKIDTVLGRTQSLAVDLAQTKTRVEVLEQAVKADDLRFSADLTLLRRETDRHGQRLAYAAGACAALVLAANLIIALVHGY